MLVFYILLAIFVIAGFATVAIYNNLVRARIHVNEGWSGIDVQLKRRADLIPNLINTVKGYTTHEASLLNQLTELRVKTMATLSVKEQAQADNMLSAALKSVIAIAENYPNLKASENFKTLQKELAVIENDLQLARRYYNGTVRENNILIQAFPSNIISTMFDFKLREFFEVDTTVRENVPEVKF